MYNIVGISEKRQKGKFCLFLVFLLFSYWKIYGMLKLAKRDEDIYDKYRKAQSDQSNGTKESRGFCRFSAAVWRDVLCPLSVMIFLQHILHTKKARI